MKKKVIVVAPSEAVKEDLLLLLMCVEGCEKEWFNIVTADELDKKWLVSAIATSHVEPLEGKCFGYHLKVNGTNVIYTGDTATLEPFISLLKKGSYFYTEAAYHKSNVHIYLKDSLPVLLKLAEKGICVYLMHLDVEEEIIKMIDGTQLKLVELYENPEV